MASHSKRKASCEIDPNKVKAAREVLGTKTLTDTVDAALSEVVNLRQRKTPQTVSAARGERRGCGRTAPC